MSVAFIYSSSVIAAEEMFNGNESSSTKLAFERFRIRHCHVRIWAASDRSAFHAVNQHHLGPMPVRAEPLPFHLRRRSEISTLLAC
jgi:hypothetical protein